MASLELLHCLITSVCTIRIMGFGLAMCMLVDNSCSKLHFRLLMLCAPLCLPCCAQITSLKSELGKAHAAAAAAVTGVSLRSGHDIIPMDALGEPYQRLARHNKLGGAVQATANFLDTTAASASQLLRQQPLARLIVFLYIVLIHLYVYFLLARMQKQALLLVSQQDKLTGVGPEHMVLQGPPAPVFLPPFPPPAAVGHP